MRSQACCGCKSRLITCDVLHGFSNRVWLFVPEIMSYRVPAEIWKQSSLVSISSHLSLTGRSSCVLTIYRSFRTTCLTLSQMMNLPVVAGSTSIVPQGSTLGMPEVLILAQVDIGFMRFWV